MMTSLTETKMLGISTCGYWHGQVGIFVGHLREGGHQNSTLKMPWNGMKWLTVKPLFFVAFLKGKFDFTDFNKKDLWNLRFNQEAATSCKCIPGGTIWTLICHHLCENLLTAELLRFFFFQRIPHPRKLTASSPLKISQTPKRKRESIPTIHVSRCKLAVCFRGYKGTYVGHHP